MYIYVYMYTYIYIHTNEEQTGYHAAILMLLREGSILNILPLDG